MKRFCKLFLLLIALLALTSCGTSESYSSSSSSVTNQYHWSGTHIQTNCHTASSSWTECSISFTPKEDFNWTISSTIDGVECQPCSGSETAGTNSGVIWVAIPSSCGSGGTLDFTDKANQLQLEFKVDSSCMIAPNYTPPDET